MSPRPLPELHEIHLLLEEFEEDRLRSRMREAFWISLVLHMAFLMVLLLAPKYLVRHLFSVPVVQEAKINDRDFTFLEMPPDMQRNAPRPDTNQISDKNRIASSRTPLPSRKLLQQLRDFRRSGDPGLNALEAPPKPPQPAQAQPQQQQGQQSQQNTQRQPENQLAQLQAPPINQRHPFVQGGFAGSAIEEAARATAPGRNRGNGGYYGLESIPNGGIKSDLDVLSDTMGVDFAPYLERILQEVRMHWYNLIPEVARPPLMRQGKVSIEFAITKNGGVAGMKLVSASGDTSLDRAAWGGITSSNPFPPLPGEFKGDYIALRFHFLYNPDRGNTLR